MVSPRAGKGWKTGNRDQVHGIIPQACEQRIAVQNWLRESFPHLPQALLLRFFFFSF